MATKTPNDILGSLRVNTETTRKKGTMLETFLAKQSRAVRDAMAEARHDDTISARAIHDYLKTLGYEGHQSTVHSWRKAGK